MFLLVPHDKMGAEYSLLNPFVEAAKRSAASRIVLMSGLGEDQRADHVPLRRLELAVLGSGLEATILRPNWFMDNFHLFFADKIRSEDKHCFPGGDGKVSFIDARDISETAAEVLTRNGFAGMGLDLTGPEALDHFEVAEKISVVAGRRIEYVNIAPESFGEQMASAGVGEDLTEVTSLTEEIPAGHFATLSGVVSEILGRPPISFSRYARDYREHWG